MSTWSNPQIEPTIGSYTQPGTVARMVVSASRAQPVATIDMLLANQRSDWTGRINNNDALSIQWGYTGFVDSSSLSLSPLFDGFVTNYHEDDNVSVQGQCRGYLLTRDVNNKTFSRMAVSDVVRALIQGLEFSSLDIEEVSDPIEVLAIQHQTTAAAIGQVNKAAGLDYAFWCDAEGGFHWGPENTDQDPALELSVHSDVISFIQMYGGKYQIVIQGRSIWHSQIVEIENWQREKELHYVTGVKHTVGIRGKGTRTILTTRKL